MPLQELPNELLAHVCSFLDRPSSVASLGLTCHKLHNFIDLGWKAFLRGRFATIPLRLDRDGGLNSSDAKSIIHGLTTLYRNWDRKALAARRLELSDDAIDLRTWKRHSPGVYGNQSMGYQPVIDSYDEFTSGEWGARREVLVWGGGIKIMMRIKETTPIDEGPEQDSEKIGERGSRDHFGHLTNWYWWKIQGGRDGPDDITALSLLQPEQKLNGNLDTESIVFGTASGNLSLLQVNVEKEMLSTHKFNTGRRPVTSMTVSRGRETMVAASLSDSDIALYRLPLDEPQEDTTTPREALSEVRVGVSGTGTDRIWSTNFISDSRIAVGVGPSFEPLQIYQITPDGLSSEPIRKFNINELCWAGREDYVIRLQERPRLNASIYPVLPFPADPSSRASTGDVFLSGGYDGVIRLHDMRSPRGYEAIFSDPTSDSHIFALQSQGQERFIAGTAHHNMLKVFDVRFPGSCAYNSIHLSPGSSPDHQKFIPKSADERFGLNQPYTGWDMYLRPRDPHPYFQYRESPVYSLSLPSPTSPFIYAGIEDSVIELAFTALHDRHPDPIFSRSPVYTTKNARMGVAENWLREGKLMDLGMYEWDNKSENQQMKFFVQKTTDARAPHRGNRDPQLQRLDERWSDPSKEGNWRHESLDSNHPELPLRPPRFQSRSAAFTRGVGRGRGRGGRGRG